MAPQPGGFLSAALASGAANRTAPWRLKQRKICFEPTIVHVHLVDPIHFARSYGLQWVQAAFWCSSLLAVAA